MRREEEEDEEEEDGRGEERRRRRRGEDSAEVNHETTHRGSGKLDIKTHRSTQHINL